MNKNDYVKLKSTIEGIREFIKGKTHITKKDYMDFSVYITGRLDELDFLINHAYEDNAILKEITKEEMSIHSIKQQEHRFTLEEVLALLSKNPTYTMQRDMGCMYRVFANMLAGAGITTIENINKGMMIEQQAYDNDTLEIANFIHKTYVDMNYDNNVLTDQKVLNDIIKNYYDRKNKANENINKKQQTPFKFTVVKGDKDE